VKLSISLQSGVFVVPFSSVHSLFFNSFVVHGYTQMKINQDIFNNNGILILLLIIGISIYSGIVLIEH